MNRTVLLVDDEPEIVDLLRLFLEKEGLEILEAHDGHEAWRMIRQHNIDLAVLDIMMPKLDGVELLKRLRAEYKLPIILLSAKNQDSDKILGLGLGADDFISKPFNPLEVVARIQAVLRRTYEFNELPSAPDEVLEQTRIGNLTLDHRNYAIYKNGNEIQLTAIEYKLLQTFMESPGRIFTKKQLFEHVWSDFYHEDANTVMVHISRLREKLEDEPRNPVYIRTIRGIGYKFAKEDDFL
ncbi:response regulator transcription factor [Paenibacillus durus]|uniref:PhoP family transcriptional regulator n=1 Tax=Paenibacillus durus ATCC 35681 TaxID=1333534 RepID=A0A0F7F9S7_PAEDU|nr:response regulator transcription factor [Paenibacillus durus]AKG34877.1 PhoP family transcriptional regulator [Paenibacillus durus ATCC 35681]